MAPTTGTKGRFKTSFVWHFFEMKSEQSVQCNICWATLGYSNCGTSNLLKHVKKKHPDDFARVMEEVEASKAMVHIPVRKGASSTVYMQEPLVKMETPGPSDSDGHKKFGSKAQKRQRITHHILRLITVDMQPLSIVKDTAFTAMLNALEPKYEMPSQNLLTRMLQGTYDDQRKALEKLLMDTGAVTLTTDVWMSHKSEMFITISAHFLTSSWDLKTCVLDTIKIAEGHNSMHIADSLVEVMDNWAIRDKVFAIVTENSSNLVAAVELLHIYHMPCFAHTLNLVVTEGIGAVEGFRVTRQKVKDVVQFFQHSVKGMDALVKAQIQMDPALHLLNDDERHWGTCYAMLQRYSQMHTQVTTVLCLLGKEGLVITQSELETINSVVAALHPFEEITSEMVGERMWTFSKVIPLVRSLQEILNDMATGNNSVMGATVAQELLVQVNRYFAYSESKYLLAASTFLDPRFKQHAFSDATALQSLRDQIQSQLRPISDEGDMSGRMAAPAQAAPTAPKSIWARFDNKVSPSIKGGAGLHAQPTLRPNVELPRYEEEDLLPRTESPMDWWKWRQGSMPQLQELAKKFLACPATCLPAEQIFSKVGEVMASRRANLSTDFTNMIIFLNKNQDLQCV